MLRCVSLFADSRSFCLFVRSFSVQLEFYYFFRGSREKNRCQSNELNELHGIAKQKQQIESKSNAVGVRDKVCLFVYFAPPRRVLSDNEKKVYTHWQSVVKLF